MPYNPGITYHGDQSLLQGMGALGGDIEKLFGRIRKTDEEVAQADLLARSAAKSKLMSPEEYEEYQNANPAKKKGIVGGLTIKWSQDMQRKMQQSQMDQRATERTPFVPYGTTVQNEVSGETIPVWMNTRNSALAIKNADNDEDSWPKLNKDVKSMSGFSLGDWQRAEKKRIDPQTGEFMAELPPSKGFTDPATGVTYGGGPAKVLRVPGQVYQEFMGRFQGLAKTQPNAMPIPDLPAAATAPPSPAAAVATQDQQALAWAKANPADPRSAAILKKLGLQ